MSSLSSLRVPPCPSPSAARALTPFSWFLLDLPVLRSFLFLSAHLPVQACQGTPGTKPAVPAQAFKTWGSAAQLTPPAGPLSAAHILPISVPALGAPGPERQLQNSPAVCPRHPSLPGEGGTIASPDRVAWR